MCGNRLVTCDTFSFVPAQNKSKMPDRFKNTRKINADWFLRYGNKSTTLAINEVIFLRETAFELTGCILDVHWISSICVWVCLYMVECVLGGGLHNHFQLSCIFDDLLCQLRRRDGHLFCPLLLTGERVIAIWAQTPSPLKLNKIKWTISCGCLTIFSL